MHNIALNVSNNAYEHLIYILSNLKDDIEVIKDEVILNYNEDDVLTEELLSRVEDIESGRAKILTRDEVFNDL
ncbi:MAG: hypothetical protein Q9M39_01430 [Sulfurovum sp.]|nr:hypothetical protein [Sulfurovum sp.]